MYRRIGHQRKLVPNLVDQFPIYWNAPGWGSVTDRPGLQKVFGSLVDGEWEEALLVGLKPNGIIPLHSDAPNRKPTRRIHVVLTTNPSCWSFHDGEWEHLSSDFLYEMDQTLPHASINLGTTIRYHLVVDIATTNLHVGGLE